MRSVTAGELTTLAKSEREVTQRFKVANGSGTLIDLTGWVEGIDNNIDIDRPVSALTVLFRRDSGTTLSLSPLRTDSTLNRLDDGTTYSPQLQGGRRITWEVATTAIGAAVVAGDFKFLFDGFIDVIDADHSPISCDCRDKGGVLVDRGIEVEAAYGSDAGVALESVMQANLDAVFGSGFIPLDTPISPSYLVSPAYIQQRQPMMDAMQALSQLPGWDARYWYDTASSTFKFRLQEPPRTKTVPDYTFGPNAYYDITRLSIDRTNIKNVIAVRYFDTAANTQLVVTVSDSTSITKYGRRYFFLKEDDGSPINTNAEATAMANAMLSDMKEPKAEAEIELPFFWPAELWDLYRFTANGVHINTDQDWAVVSITHKLRRGHHRTVLTVRGAPAGGYLTWLDRPKIAGGEQRPGEVGPEAKIEVFGPPSATQAFVLYTATGGTAPLTYQRRLDVDGISTGTYSAPAALGSGVTEWITIHQYRATRIFLRVIDATGLQGNADPFFIPGETPSTDPTPNNPTVPLRVRARVTATTATTMTVRVAVADPYPQGAASATITYTEIGTGAATSPATGGTVTPAATLTEAAGTYIDYTVTRPLYSAGQGRVTFTITAANRTSDSDAIDVPERDRDTQSLSMRILRVSETATQIVARVEVISPNAGATVTVAYDNGGLTVTPASGGTLTSTTSFGTTAHIDHTITKDVYGGTQRRVTFTASATGFIDATDGVDAAPASLGAITLTIGTSAASNAGAAGPPYNQIDQSWSTTGMPSGVTYDVGYDNGVSGGSGSASGATSPKTFSSVTFAASPGKGVITITAYNADGHAILTKSSSRTYTT